MDIERKRGDTYPIEIIVNSNGSPLNISGASFVLTVDPSKTPVDNTNNLFALTGTITDAPGGRVSFTPTELQADHVGRFFHDIQMTDGSGAKRTIDSGKFTFTQDITKV